MTNRFCARVSVRVCPASHASESRNDSAVTIAGELHLGAIASSERGANATEAALDEWRYLRHGSAGHLNGVYALALQDGAEHALYRDPSGLQNLFWCRMQAGDLAFASQLPALLAMGGVPRRIDRASLHEYLRFLDIAAPRTLFEGVHALEAGHLLSFNAGSGTAVDTKPAAALPAPVDRFDEAVDRLDRLLREAVALRLEGSVRPALLLSGGVDSALIAAVAAKLRPDIVAVTVGFEAPDLDESPVAAEIAANLGLRHEVLRFERRALLSAFGRAAADMEQPTADPSLPATILALDHCRERFDALLDGTGADEAVGAMPPRHLRLAVSVAGRLPGSWRLRIARTLRAAPGLATHAPVFDFEHPAEPFIRWGGFGCAEIERLCGQPVSFTGTQFYRTFERFPRNAHFERYSALIDAMPSERVNQAMLITGMRMRFPFCDLHVDAFLRQLRTDFRDLPGQPKRILRALLARYLPSGVWDLPKRGFTFPLQQFLTADDSRLVREHLDPARWRRHGLLEVDEVARLAREFAAGDSRLTFRAWALVVLGAWLEKHDELH